MCEAVRNHETTPYVLLGEKQMIRSHLQINENQKITQENQPVFQSFKVDCEGDEQHPFGGLQETLMAAGYATTCPNGRPLTGLL
jgi:hypothetical protein